MNKIFLYTIIFLLPLWSSGQKAPGGVSDDSDNNANCRLWLDASSLNQADGTDVELWEDISISNIVDNAFWDDQQDFLPPEFRSDPAAGINGKPTISFENGGMLSIGVWPNGVTSEDLNSNGSAITTYEQSIFIAFRTSSDVSSRQIIWEEGGNLRGFNIYILNGTIRIGVYDGNLDNTDPGPGTVPRFGYTYREQTVQPNTTYVLSLVYDVPTGADGNVLITNGFNPNSAEYSGLTGTLNGQKFEDQDNNGINEPMLWGGNLPGSSGHWGSEASVGGVWTHPDPIGIGGLNRTSYHELGPVNTNTPTGSFGFTGRISEICYYAFAVSDCQRIIIENYLAAKYFANVISNDKYIYQTSYGDDVIGIGKESTTDLHNVSQGKNLFEFSTPNFSSTFSINAPSYILTGHNNNPISWTDDNVPDTISIQRLRRVWRWDFTGTTSFVATSPDLRLKIDPADLPILPSGFSTYGIMVDRSNGVLPNFGPNNSDIIGLFLNPGSGLYEADIEITDGTYLSIVAIKPQIQFTQSTAFSIEGDVPPADQAGQTLTAELNFTPPGGVNYGATISLIDDNVNISYGLGDGTANGNGNDYYSTGSTINLSFTGGTNSEDIDISIVNDNVTTNDDPVERFWAVITGVSGGLTIGQSDTVTYRILDNDPDPSALFPSGSIDFDEVTGTVQVPVQIIGTFTGTKNVTVELLSGQGTATPGIDFTAVSPQVIPITYDPNGSIGYFTVNIIDDDTPNGSDPPLPYDEFDEWFRLAITNVSSGIGFDNTFDIVTDVNIIDLDPEPTVQFQAGSSEGYEGVSDPRIYVELSAPSAKLISIPFSITGGTATNGTSGDYQAEVSATLIIQPGDIEGFLYFDIPTGQTALFIYSDAPEDPETIVFTLTNSPGPVNAQLGSPVIHTFTIRDYEQFQNTGVAGIGKFKDNTFWMVAEEATSGASSIPNLSPRPINIIQNNSGRRPGVIDNAINDKKVLRFDGTDDYLAVGNPSTTGQSSLINTAGSYDSKSMFFVITPHDVSSNSYQTIYEQGGGVRGISVYMKSGIVYFQVWNVNNDDGSASPDLSPWGHQSPYAITQSSQPLLADESYVISVHYQNTILPSVPTNEGLRLYINGEKQTPYTGPVGRLYTHGGRTNIGCSENQSFYDDGAFTNNNPARCFDGDIAEIIYFNEPNETRFDPSDPAVESVIRMNETRVQILHNYLAAKYDITSTNSNLGANQLFDDSFSDASVSANFFGNDLAGVGSQGGAPHLDSKGRTELRVTNPSPSTSDFFLLWGHNGESLTNTWEFSGSGSSLPPTINERSGRVWKFFESGANINTVRIDINYDQSNNADAITSNQINLLRLLIHNNLDPNDFSNASVLNPTSIAPGGNVVQFNDVPVANGMYIALGNTSDYFGTPLPIELLDFDARLNGPVVDLSWATATEINNEKFIVERAGANLVWEEILTVPGAGNSTTTLFYNEKDRNPLKGVSYYRLKQVDYDGTSTISDMVSVFNPGTALDDELSIYPNPSLGNSVFLRIPELAMGDRGYIEVFDISGKARLQKEIEELNSIEELSHSGLPAGVYLISLRSNSINQTKKLVVQ